jgi:hypothetical protein
MARWNCGSKVKERTKRLLEALLAYANDELENVERLKIQVNWQTANELVVRTQIRFLEGLTALDRYPGKLNAQEIKEALHRCQDFLKILKDNRPGTKGLHDWHFTLKLWHSRHEIEANLKQFDQEWEHLRHKSSQ